MNRHTKNRSNKGMSTVVLMLLIALFIICPLGLAGFEMARAFLIQQELRNITDSAALAGTAAMASAPEYDSSGNLTTYTQRQQIAMQAALQTFEFNSILQTPFGTTNVQSNQNPVPAVPQTPTNVHTAILNIILLDVNGNQVPTGTPAATLTVQAYYKDAPIFVSGILPIQTSYTLQATSNGGLPQLDVILCMDVSGSMDDQTNVTFVNRYWDTATQNVKYDIASTSGRVGNGNMFNLQQPPNTGTSLNVFPPMNLENASYFGGTGSNTYPYTWSETPDTPSPAVTWSKLKGLRSNNTYPAGPATMPEQGMPPGNFQSANPSVNRTNPATGQPYDPHMNDATGGFTDMVVAIPAGTNVSYRGNSYSFPNVAVAVEAQRGNMESSAILKTACGNKFPPQISSGLCKAGYYKAYMSYVLRNAQPMATARDAAFNFFNTMNISTNAHFGLVCFSSTAGTSATSTFPDTNANLSPSYTAGGTGTFPNPLVKISKTDPTAAQFTRVTEAIQGNPVNNPIEFDTTIYPLRAEGATNIADSLTEALNELDAANQNLARPTAKRAVILFTDGVPNRPGTGTAPNTLSVAQATRAKNLGIPIYTIGLSQNPSIQPLQNALLGNSAGGIAKESGNNAIYIAVSNSAQLDQAFQTIARSLCAIH